MTKAATPQLSTPGHRAWFAWHCLPRDEKGQPPSQASLERANHLSKGALYKLIWDVLKRPGPDVLDKLARSLQVMPEWLWRGIGPGPHTSWTVIPRPDAPPGAASRQALSKSGMHLEKHFRKASEK